MFQCLALEVYCGCGILLYENMNYFKSERCSLSRIVSIYAEMDWLMLKYVVLRTHGGLGNQLFQVLLGRVLSEHKRIQLCEVHDLRYPHAFPRCQELIHSGCPSGWQRFVSDARIPKILQRTLGEDEAPWRFGNCIYLDGYFQNKKHFERFQSTDIAGHLQRFRDELIIKPADIDDRLFHLRIGDFFNSQKEAISHVQCRLEAVPSGAHIMTNDEELLQQIEIAKIIKAKRLSLVGTKDKSAIDVLRAMSRYRYIDANDSTLTFWSSVLAGSQVSFEIQSLSECRDYFTSIR